MSITRGFLLLFLFSSLNCNVYAQEEIKISLANDTKDEQQTKEQLQRLLASYDLKKWIVTKSILIDEKAIPHSHPVLTLSTRHLKDDELLLSTFVHEQMHWFVIQDQERLSAAIKSFNPCFQKCLWDFRKAQKTKDPIIFTIPVIYLEYRANRELLGELVAKQVMKFWAEDHYTWIYKTLLERPRDVGNVMFKHELVPGL